MDEFQHHERLSAENDFEGGQWIGEEFFYTSKKAKRQQTEEDRLYGVFQGSSDDEDEGFKRRRRRGGSADPSALHKEVSFVSSGHVMGTMEPQDEEIVVSDKHGSPSSGKVDVEDQERSHSGNDEAEEYEPVLGDSGTARLVFQAAQEKRQAAALEREGAQQRKRVLKADPELAKFENHSKGIGSKLLKLMGWKPGEGLGKTREGISKPLEAAMRPKGAGLGAVGAEPSLQPKQNETVSKKKPEEKAQAQSAFKRAWMAKNRTKAANFSVVKSADELVAEEEAAGGVFGLAASPAVTILDFTGPQTRVVNNMEDLNAIRKDDDTGDIPFPELQHNLKLLVDIAEADIRRLDGKVRREQENAEMLQSQVEQLEKDVHDLDKELEHATQVLQMVSIVDERMHEQHVAPDELLAIYEEIKEHFPAEFTMFDCSAIVVYQLLPSLKSELASWNPMQSPLQWLAQFVAWKRLLESKSAPLTSHMVSEVSPADPFSELVMEALVPPLRMVVSAWDPFQPGPLLHFFDHWTVVLPPPIYSHLLRSLILPRIQAVTHSWAAAPAMGPPPHLWLHPWLPHMPTELKDLYPFVRKGLGQLLVGWIPPEPSAQALLSPWKQVWTLEELSSLTDKSIVPALEGAMHHTLDLYPQPTRENTTPCNWCAAWTEILSVRQLAGIYERAFFPKLHEVLHFWLLNSPQVNYVEVFGWLDRMKQIISPPSVQVEPRVHYQLTVARTVVTDFQQSFPLPRGYPRVQEFEAHGITNKHATNAAIHEYRKQNEQVSIKDFLSDRAQQAELSFVPRLGRLISGLQVYALGNLSVVIDSHAGVAKAFMKDRWVPMGVDEVINEAQKLNLSSNR